ncbi:basic-leucine zipper transcription factor family protein [Striga asiatica]|uniref:Basic-leucine zipper transcription factor family protein n=1 Tax=Striga asiatica TaxID=4170 RepID=A0A5A7QF57_STRAF|nr:basic-leucine zipper transcription factor family protein [Striga asiatica]
MEQLPPKAPIPMSHTWSWADEFLDFSAWRRGAHRRTVSDPIAFVESAAAGFEGLDDEQLRSMFSDEVTVAEAEAVGPPSDPSTPSNSDGDERRAAAARLKNELGEADGGCSQPAGNKSSESNYSGVANIVDPKRIKRILANRQSAQRSRVRKLHYISELERSVTSLQTEVSALSPRVAFLDHQRLLLNVDNSALKQRIAALAQDKIFKDAHQEALKKEIERLRKIYHEQNIKKMEANAGDDVMPISPVATASKRGCLEDE